MTGFEAFSSPSVSAGDAAEVLLSVELVPSMETSDALGESDGSGRVWVVSALLSGVISGVSVMAGVSDFGSLFAFCCMSCNAAIFMKRRYLWGGGVKYS